MAGSGHRPCRLWQPRLPEHEPGRCQPSKPFRPTAHAARSDSARHYQTRHRLRPFRLVRLAPPTGVVGGAMLCPLASGRKPGEAFVLPTWWFLRISAIGDGISLAVTSAPNIRESSGVDEDFPAGGI